MSNALLLRTIEASVRTLNEMASFAEAPVSQEKHKE